jgi:imidazole glycerol-phosphate synthase subunit HisH
VIHVIDYGAGNLASVQKGLTAAGARVSVIRSAGDLDSAGAIVIPGVGHFGATAVLHDTWRRAIAARLDSGASLLGICLGMQWLFEGSDEAPQLSGAGLLSGRCFRLSGPVKVPHVGWNTLSVTRNSTRLLDGIASDASVYFTHSFAAPVTDDAIATSSHGVTFAACVERGRVWATQFHPEKSGRVGMQILTNFVKASAECA